MSVAPSAPQEPSYATPDRVAYAAGILPFARYNGETVFLVGRDAQDGTWSDFGGKYESRDKNEMETAQREFYEETCGMVMDMKALRMRMSFPQTFQMLQSTTQSKHPYYMHLLEVPFDPGLRAHFRRSVAFLRFSRLPKTLVEKADVQWVTLAQLRRLTLRAVFAQSVRRHEAVLVALATDGMLHGSFPLLPTASSSSPPSSSSSSSASWR